MDLETFVRESLIGLARGVRAANVEMNEGADRKHTYFMLWRPLKDASTVEFDVAVTASKEGATGASGRINVVVPDLDLDGKGKFSTENASRVKFSVKVEQAIM